MQRTNCSSHNISHKFGGGLTRFPAFGCELKNPIKWLKSSHLSRSPKFVKRRKSAGSGGDGGIRKTFPSNCNSLEVSKPAVLLPHLIPRASARGQAPVCKHYARIAESCPAMRESFQTYTSARLRKYQEGRSRFLLTKRFRLSVTTKVVAPSLMISTSPLAMSR